MATTARAVADAIEAHELLRIANSYTRMDRLLKLRRHVPSDFYQLGQWPRVGRFLHQNGETLPS